MLWVLIRSASPRRGASNEYPQHMSLQKTKKKFQQVLTEKKKVAVCVKCHVGAIKRFPALHNSADVLSLGSLSPFLWDH